MLGGVPAHSGRCRANRRPCSSDAADATASGSHRGRSAACPPNLQLGEKSRPKLRGRLYAGWRDLGAMEGRFGHPSVSHMSPVSHPTCTSSRLPPGCWSRSGGQGGQLETRAASSCAQVTGPSRADDTDGINRVSLSTNPWMVVVLPGWARVETSMHRWNLHGSPSSLLGSIV